MGSGVLRGGPPSEQVARLFLFLFLFRLLSEGFQFLIRYEVLGFSFFERHIFEIREVVALRQGSRYFILLLVEELAVHFHFVERPQRYVGGVHHHHHPHPCPCRLGECGCGCFPLFAGTHALQQRGVDSIMPAATEVALAAARELVIFNRRFLPGGLRGGQRRRRGH